VRRAVPPQAERAPLSAHTLGPKTTRLGSDDDSSRRTALRAVRISLWVWPAFATLDVYMCTVVVPGAPLGLFLVYRAAVELALFAAFRAAQSPGASVPVVFRTLNLSFGLAAVAIALMAVHLGGITSPYMHGISIIALVRAALIPGYWRRALPTFLRIGLAFPLVMGLGAVLSPLARAEWLTPSALSLFAANYVFVISSAALGLITGDSVWRTQQQLYRQRKVGRYRLQAPIGKGGMGEVWLARDQTLDRNVALKLLHVDAAPTPDFVRRFEREARATSQLRGPHIVQIFDFGASDDGLHYIAMEYLVGMDLDSMVERFGPLPEARAICFIEQACRALEEAHGAGLIHRDIKPHNLFVTRVGDDPDFLKLLDFGLVRLRVPTPDADSLTWSGFLVGTPAFVAPEVWNGGDADERSDVYALGITLQFLLTGRTPVRRKRSSALDSAGVPPIGHPELAMIVAQATAENPDERIQSARDLGAALAAVPLPTSWTREEAIAFWNEADRTRFQ